jgi:hypothetical protein
MASLIGANKIYAEDVVLAEFRFRVRNTVHISTRISIGLAKPDHTVPYGTVLSRTLSQALRARLRSVVCPYGTGLQTVRNGI